MDSLFPGVLVWVGTVVAFAILYVVARRFHLLPMPVHQLARSPSVATTSEHLSNMMVTIPASSLDAHPWQVTALSSLREVEETLDYLENHGVTEREVVVVGDKLFAVRWR